MKRKPFDPTTLQPIKPFFWTKCKLCCKEFKREPGWRFQILRNHFYQEYCLCHDCAPSLETAAAIRDKFMGRPTTGTFPPPPTKKLH